MTSRRKPRPRRKRDIKTVTIPLDPIDACVTLEKFAERLRGGHLGDILYPKEYLNVVDEVNHRNPAKMNDITGGFRQIVAREGICVVFARLYEMLAESMPVDCSRGDVAVFLERVSHEAVASVMRGFRVEKETPS